MLKTILPQSSVLRKYIEFFYVFTYDHPVEYSYLAFPHINTGMSFFEGVLIKRGEFTIDILSSLQIDSHIEMLGKYTRPVAVHYHGDIKEISIVFKPLGINRFIKEDYYKVAPDFSQPYQNTEWLNFGKTLFIAKDQIALLEDFLISQLNDTPEIRKIEQALPYIENVDANYSVAEVAEKTGYSLKSFQRHFTKHMGCSPSDYKRIARFRSSLTSKLFSNDFKTLTSISYNNNYFDQSYFIKEFRKLTNQNPKQFFREVSLLDGKKIVWEIL